MTDRFLRAIYPGFTGLLFGLLQTGLYFQLSFALSSSFRTYLMITVGWLIGSALGVQLARRRTLDRRVVRGLLALMLVAYGACIVLLRLAPFNTQVWPVYALLVVAAGLYPGVFFVRMGRAYAARTLFLGENNGFIVGLATGTLAFMLLGQAVLWVAPAGFVALLLAWPEPRLVMPHAKQTQNG